MLAPAIINISWEIDTKITRVIGLVDQRCEK